MIFIFYVELQFSICIVKNLFFSYSFFIFIFLVWDMLAALSFADLFEASKNSLQRYYN